MSIEWNFRFDLISILILYLILDFTESDDSVAKSVELDFYCFVNKISL
jgi:hypothetical protein